MHSQAGSAVEAHAVVRAELVLANRAVEAGVAHAREGVHRVSRCVKRFPTVAVTRAVDAVALVNYGENKRVLCVRLTSARFRWLQAFLLV